MRKFLIRILFFGVVFILNSLFIYIVDPYNLFFDSNFIENDIKKLTLKKSNEVMPRGNTLWKLNEFKKDPKANIIIGDSRSMGFDTEIIKSITNTEYYNFGVPGGNFKTLRDIFWYANDHIPLKNVVIQIGFHTYNETSNYDLIKSVDPYLKNPYKTFFKNWFIFDSFEALKYKLINEPIVDDETDNIKLQKKNFANWDQILHRQGYKVLSKYKYPEDYYHELELISRFCQQNNINLTFVVFPSHPDYFKIIKELNLSEDRLRFIKDIKKLGKTLDYTNSEKLITNKMLYYDLYHLKHSVIDSLSYEIWNEN